MSSEHNPNRLTRHPGQQGARPSGGNQPEVEKFTTGTLSSKQPLTLGDFMLTKPQGKRSRNSSRESNSKENDKRTRVDSDSEASSSEMESSEHTPAPKAPKFWPRYLVMSGQDQSFRKLYAIAISKAIQGLCGEPKDIRRLRSGDLLIEVHRDAQSRSLLGTLMLHNCPVKVTEHRTLNYCKGVIHSHENLTCSEDEILEYLAPTGVTAVHRIVNRHTGATPTLIITFHGNTLPTAIKLGYEYCRVSPYIPNPLRCFVCQNFGHHGKACTKKSPVCAKCASKDHTSSFENPCKNPAKCSNCSGNHPAYSRSCPVWIQEQQVQKLKIQQNLTFPQARKLVQAKDNGVSYAAAVAKPVRSVRDATTQTCEASTQTDELQASVETQPPGSSNCTPNEPQVPKPPPLPKTQSKAPGPASYRKPPRPANNLKTARSHSNRFSPLADLPGMPPSRKKAEWTKIHPP